MQWIKWLFESSEVRNGEETRDASIRETIEQCVRAAVLLRPLVEFVPHRGLYNHERSIKSRRVVDLRE